MGVTKKTNEQFLKEVAEVHGGLIVPIESYQTTMRKIDFRCTVCGHVWGATPNNILRGRGCAKCADERFGESRKLSQDDFMAKVFKKHGNDIYPISDHIGVTTKIDFKCNVCGNVWSARPDNIMSGRGCPQCKINNFVDRVKLTRERFEADLFRAHGGDIELADEYIDTGTNVDFKCNRCGNRWSAKPSHITQGHGCPDCCDKSRGEELVADYLGKAGLKFDREVTFHGLKLKKSLRYDFAVLDPKTFKPMALIEFDGEQHFRPIEYFGGVKMWERMKKSDEMKNDYARKNGIKLIRIPFYKISAISEILESELREVRLYERHFPEANQHPGRHLESPNQEVR